ncbi:hypothetical protein RSP673_011140 [Ralstonia solanacearum P673]|uniref:hypothetical protein n=1 Tax=Ralstonia solanacearum TaxID=305 RepID=UPI00044944FF|nr:hypothetical protein [Ralstonia solanacearum]EUJ15167.1 hypothetical protein RSP673_07050 [Ralstonia solanacearum P673]MCL9851198.1 hypothetical protein [Ralstonia solanacearum]MCL9855775.1 hypothetical protein [Ralstonia solanacearum]MCL9860291.1 hypothetical protein [Ralstonia solanacearum]MCL9865522.1 hypothetical protein [Ralstonia solanacearum]
MSKNTKHAAYALTPEVESAIQEVHDALARRKLLDEAANAAPAQIAGLEQEINRLRGEIAGREADTALCAGADLAGIERAIKKLESELATKETELRRAKARIEALEARAPEIDAAIDTAGGALNLEVSMLVARFKSVVAQEMREAAKALQPIMERARAMGPQLNDFCVGAYLPDPETFMLSAVNYKSQNGNAGVNLLRGESGMPNPVVEVMKPVNEALAALGRHSAYVPLAKRPKPYVRKGTYDGPGGRVDRPNESEPQEPETPRMTIEEALAQPYQKKAQDWRGRSFNMGADMDIGSQMVGDVLND